MPVRLDHDLVKRSAQWASRLRDEAARLRKVARGTRSTAMRVEATALANALNRAARQLDSIGGARPRRKKSP
jgi:hypothetical protein